MKTRTNMVVMRFELSAQRLRLASMASIISMIKVWISSQKRMSEQQGITIQCMQRGTFTIDTDVFITSIDTKRDHWQISTSIYAFDLLSNQRHTIKFASVSNAIGINVFTY